VEHLVVGQVVEFLVWAELASTSAGQLHVYLPLWDRGIDGLIHRRTDGAYVPVQVKGHSVVRKDGWIHLVIPDESLRDDNALLLCALLEGDRLAPWVMVVDEGTFKKMATISRDTGGRDVYGAAIRLDARSESRWDPFLVDRSGLAARLGVDGALPTGALEAQRSPADRPLGILGEAEVLRRLAQMEELSIFRPFPDLETAEIVVRHVGTFGVVGIQVKTVSLPELHTETTVNIQRPSFRPASSTWFVVLTWQRDASRFHTEFLLIPSTEIEGISHLEGHTLQISFTPGSTRHAVVEPYRRPLQDLGKDIALLAARNQGKL